VTQEPGAATSVRWPYFWVAVMAAAFFAVALAATWVTYLDFHLNNIGYYDLSINQQALSSTIHSNRPFPFYESTDCGRTARCSFLLVHPALVAYGLVVPYAVWPSPVTLFAVQDLGLALAAVPLFALSREVTQSDRLSLGIVAAYLVWFPAFSGIFSFHWEAFIPLEFFLIFWLWLTHRYLLALPVVLVSCVTLEIVPVLLFFMAIFFLLPWVSPFWRTLRKEFQALRRLKSGRLAELRSFLNRGYSTVFEQPRVVASLYLLFGSVAVYVLLHTFVTTGGPLLGLPTLPAKYNIPLARPVYAANFTWANFSTAIPAKLTYWLVIYATLALVPLFAPRTLILAAPWIAFSFFATAGYYRFGDQYAFVAAALLFVGFAYGVARLKKWFEASPRRAPAGESPPGSPSERMRLRAQQLLAEIRQLQEGGVEPAPRPTATTAGSAVSVSPQALSAEQPSTATAGSVDRALSAVRRRRKAAAVLSTILVVVIAFNLFLSPLNPVAASLKNERPFVPQSGVGFWGGLSTTDYNHMEEVVSMVGPHTIVAVSPMLFTFFANDPYAYPMLASLNTNYLPFAADTSTQDVVFLDHGGTSMPSFLRNNITNPLLYGVRAWIPTTYLGAVLLFEKGYTGPCEVLGVVPTFEGGTYTAGFGLSPGAAGVLSANNSSQSGTVIETAPKSGAPGFQETGQVFTGLGVTLPPGVYNVTMAINGSITATPTGLKANTTLVTLLLSGFQVVLNRTLLDLSDLSGSGWTTLSFTLTLPYPVLDFTIAGFNHHDYYRFSVDYVAISASS